jgi:uncharacterized protein
VKILVDADACPVKSQIVKVARKYALEVLMVTDTSHQLEDGYSQIVMVDQGRDAADIALANRIQTGDIIVTQDYGVAAMALGKKAIPLHPNGWVYNEKNMDQLLFERFLSGKSRRAGMKTSHPRKRVSEDDQKFETLLETLCKEKVQG